VEHAAFSPDSAFLVTSCADGYLTQCAAQVWDVASGRPAANALKHADGVLYAAFSPDSRQVVSTSEDFTAVVWDRVTGRPAAPAFRHEQAVLHADFSADGRWLLTASADQTARLWSIETGDALSPPLRHLGVPARARFLPGNQRVLTADAAGNTWIWPLHLDERPPEELAAFARLLAAGNGMLSTDPDPALGETPAALWQRLRAKYPKDFTTTEAEIAAWHSFQAEESELGRQWGAAAFHLERLLSLAPGDEDLRKRLAQAKGHLK
jgi:hypothetical protein